MKVVDPHPRITSGGMRFSNRLMRLTPVFGVQGPLWQVSPQPVDLNGREPSFIHASFAAVDDSSDGSYGSLSENEHGLNGEFYFAPEFFDLLQQAALSAADLEIGVTFAARDERVEALSLTLNHKTA